MNEVDKISEVCKNWQNEDKDRRTVVVITLEQDKDDPEVRRLHCGINGYRNNIEEAFYTVFKQDVKPLSEIIRAAFEANAVRKIESALEKLKEAEKRVKEAKDE